MLAASDVCTTEISQEILFFVREFTRFDNESSILPIYIHTQGATKLHLKSRRAIRSIENGAAHKIGQ